MEIKWIKINTNIFDNRKIKQIECLPSGDTIVVIWYKLLCLAGTINDNGSIYFTKEIPYTSEMLATAFNRPLNVVELALNIFVKFEMVEIVEDFIYISNWEKYQNVEGMELIREQTRKRVSKFREKQKGSLQVEDVKRYSNVTVTQGNAIDIDIEEDKELDKDKELEIKKERKHIVSADVLEILNYWNSKKIIVHDLNEDLEKIIQKKITEESIDIIKGCIDRYNTVIKDNSYFFKTKWKLIEFLKQKNALPDFKEDGSKWINYFNSNSGKKTINTKVSNSLYENMKKDGWV